MKILIVGSNKTSRTESIYKKHLKINHVVKTFNSHDIFLAYYSKNILNKILFRCGLSLIYKKINKELLELVEVYKPTVIWVFKGLEIYPDTLLLLRKKKIKLFNYNLDNPFIHTSKGSGNKNVLNSIKHYDLHFSYIKEVVETIKKDFSIKSTYLPFYYSETKKPANVKTDKACFIGNPDDERVEIIKLLLSEGIAVDVYGLNWEKYSIKNENFHCLNVNFNGDFSSVSDVYRIQLNFFRPHNKGSHNLRTFELPALGCIMLAPETADHTSFFKEGEEAFFYKDDEELIEKCKLILALSEDEAYQIRLNAYNRSISSDYSSKGRANQVLKELKKLIN